MTVLREVESPPSVNDKTDKTLWKEIESDDAPEIVADLLEHGCDKGISDLFFCAEEHHFSVSGRHLGLWKTVGRLSKDTGKRCISHIKSMSGMDIAERRRPHDGRWIFVRANGEKVDLRISTIPTLHGEDCTLRFLLRSTQLLGLEKLGMVQRDHNCLLQMVNSPSGLILVTGPTGSGKTTTLYACLNYLNNGHRKINTIEDPIEYGLVNVRQSQVNPVIDVHFAELLRGVLRQRPTSS